ncbi:MAG: ROK family protein [Bacteroidales bacterium]|nr:ROK family protein [Bacteroidales bacterium]
MLYKNDRRIVLTLDAGGTNFVFSAIRGMESVVDSVVLPSNGDNLSKCLASIIDGFKTVISKLDSKPSAISFAFPGPADYPNGIIGDLGNLPGFKGGVALSSMLQEQFKLPVFINNDGDLFAYGEAIAGLLPEVNKMLSDADNPKQYRNLFGVTLGTGFGGGFVVNNQLYIGDNSAGAEVWLMRNSINVDCFAEEGASIRAVQRVYHKHSKRDEKQLLSPKEISEIIDGSRDGDLDAARLAFQTLGTVVGDALANVVTLTDSVVVIGGGLSKSYKYFAPAMFSQLNGKISNLKGEKIDRLELKVFDLENTEQRLLFTKGELRKVKVPFSEAVVDYDSLKRVGVGLSRLGTSYAVAVGAYAFALNKLNAKS